MRIDFNWWRVAELQRTYPGQHGDRQLGRSWGGLQACGGTVEKNVVAANRAAGAMGQGGGLAYCNGTI